MAQPHAAAPQAADSLPIARELMEPVPLRQQPDTDLLDAVDAMLQAQVDTAFVAEADGPVLGVLLERDCLHAVSRSVFEAGAGAAHDEAGGAETVAGTMRRHVPRVEASDDVFGVAQRFLETSERLLPVVEGPRLVGCIARSVVLAAICRTATRIAARERGAEAAAHEERERPVAIEQMQRVFARLTPAQLATLMHRAPHDE